MDDRFTPEELRELAEAGELTQEHLAILHPQDARVALKFLLDSGAVGPDDVSASPLLPPFGKGMQVLKGAGKNFPRTEFPPGTGPKTPPKKFIEKSNDFYNSLENPAETAAVRGKIQQKLGPMAGAAVIGDPTPDFLKQGMESVFDSPLKKALRALGQFLGADDPESQVLGVASPLEVDNVVMGLLKQASAAAQRKTGLSGVMMPDLLEAAKGAGIDEAALFKSLEDLHKSSSVGFGTADSVDLLSEAQRELFRRMPKLASNGQRPIWTVRPY